MPSLRSLWPRAGPLLALLVVLAALAWRDAPFNLDGQPADSWIYTAISDEPAVFTAQPWGFRVLGPWLVHLLPAGVGFERLSPAALALTGALLFLYLRRWGSSPAVALAGVAAFAFSAPVAVSIDNPYLCEPVTVLAEVTFLLAVQSGAGLGVLALLGVLAALSKEILVVLLPLVYFERRLRTSHARALGAAAVVALPALAAHVLMRAAWVPHLRTVYSPPDLGIVTTWLLPRLGEGETGILLGGVLPLALLGALRRKSRPYLWAAGYLAAAFLFLPFVAWAYDPRPNRIPFFDATVRRLLIYALPVLLPLAALAVDRLLPHLKAPEPAVPRPRRALNVAAYAAALALGLAPLWAMDDYRRIELNRGGLYGPVIRAICHQTLRLAELVEKGGWAAYPISDKDPRAWRIRWFLRDGWGSFPYYERRVTMQAPEASVLLPCLRPRPLELALDVTGPGPASLEVRVNGSGVGRVEVGVERREQRLAIPPQLLFRGDNLLSFVAAGGEHPQLEFHALALRAAAEAGS